jgi:hypothetical protein
MGGIEGMIGTWGGMGFGMEVASEAVDRLVGSGMVVEGGVLVVCWIWEGKRWATKLVMACWFTRTNCMSSCWAFRNSLASARYALVSCSVLSKNSLWSWRVLLDSATIIERNSVATELTAVLTIELRSVERTDWLVDFWGPISRVEAEASSDVVLVGEGWMVGVAGAGGGNGSRGKSVLGSKMTRVRVASAYVAWEVELVLDVIEPWEAWRCRRIPCIFLLCLAKEPPARAVAVMRGSWRCMILYVLVSSGWG